jgi:CheY-like chemotaxis protein
MPEVQAPLLSGRGTGHIRGAMPRILLIEDDRSIRRTFARALTASGHEVSEAANGADGLRLWRERGADLVLTDMQMPQMNGIEVILQLRASAPTLAVIAMSGGDRSGDLHALRDAKLLGAVGLLEKPFPLETLIGAIAAALEQAHRKRT